MKKILIVDDNRLLARLWEIRLKAEDFEVFISNSGKDAIKKASELKPDAIILDVLIPDMNGLDVAKELAKNIDLKKIPVIFTSNTPSSDVVTEAYRLGARQFLTKTKVTPSGLVDAIKEVLNLP